jgi:uncharacterized protein YcfJ
MKTMGTLMMAAVLAAALVPAQAADAPKVVNGVKLGKICDACGVVTAVKRETRKGKGSGVGAVGGAVAGGVVGNKATDHSTLGTVGGAAVGGLLGNEIEKQLKKQKVYVTTVTLKNGTVKKFDGGETAPDRQAGSVVEVTADGPLKKR